MSRALSLIDAIRVRVWIRRLQHHLYPETNFFRRSSFGGYYDVYVNAPKTLPWFLYRLRDLGVTFFSLSVIAPRPLFLNSADREMYFAPDRWSTYSALGLVVAMIWLVAGLAASIANLYTIRRVTRERRALLVLCAGWLAGAFGLFFFYGNEMMLPSEYWVAHLVLWVGLGLDSLARLAQTRPRPGPRPAQRWTRSTWLAATVVLAAFVIGQGCYVLNVIRGFYDGPLLTL